MTNNEEKPNSRLEYIEQILQTIAVRQLEATTENRELRKLVESNAKSIAALTNNLTALSDEVMITQRQLRDSLRRIDDNSTNIREMTMDIRDTQADIRELQIENKRILRYLESRVNQEDTIDILPTLLRRGWGGCQFNKKARGERFPHIGYKNTPVRNWTSDADFFYSIHKIFCVLACDLEYCAKNPDCWETRSAFCRMDQGGV